MEDGSDPHCCSPIFSALLTLHPEWTSMYNPSKEQAEQDRAAAFKSGVPHGFVQPGNKWAGQPTIDLWVVSEMVRGDWL
jgi:hypothetical protein